MLDEMTIFYADDDADDLDFFRTVTENIARPIRLFTHSRGEGLLQAIFNPPPSPHIVFLDLNMPGKDGFRVLEELRRHASQQDVPVVVLSTSADPRNIDRVRALGANFYITKPDSFAALERSIRHVLAIDWKTFRPCGDDFVYRVRSA